MKVVKTESAEDWAGTIFGTRPDYSMEPVPLDAQHTRLSLRVWSPRAPLPVLLKVEAADNTELSCETLATVSVANGWETLSFDFSDQAPGTPGLKPDVTYDKATVFFDFGTKGVDGGGGTFYFDDLATDFAGTAGAD